MRVLTLNWGHGPYSISKMMRDIENALKPEVQFLHVQENGKPMGRNYISLSGWFMYRVYYVWAHVSGRQYGTGVMPYLKFCRIIKAFHPDIVHIHCPNAFSVNLYKVLKYLKKNKIPTVITNHAEFFYTGNCAHAEECLKFTEGCHHCDYYKDRTNSLFFDRTAWAWKKMKEAFENFEKIRMVAVSPWEEQRMKMSVISKKLPTSVVVNGIDTAVFNDRGEVAVRGDRKVVLHVTAHFSADRRDLKGGWYILELARQCDNIDFWIAGTCDAAPNDLPDNVNLLGNISNQNELASYYRAADATVITSKRETLGMACLESLCCGTPIVGFRNGGSESVAMPEYSEFVSFGDVDSLKEALLKMVNKKAVLGNKMSKQACELFDRKTMADAYLKIYREVLGSDTEGGRMCE